MRVKFIFIALALIGCFSALSAQITLSLTDQEVNKGDVFSLDVNVTKFDSVVGMQFSMVWDKSVLTPIGVENYGLPDLMNSSFGIFEEALTVQWIDQSLRGVTVAEGGTIFTVKFRAIEATDSTEIGFSNMPTAIELIYNNDQFSEVTTESSTVRIMGSTSIEALNNAPFQVHQNQPNPFTQYTNIQIEANAPQDAQIIIYDQNGKRITSLDTRLANGENTIRLDRTLFPTTGTYYYQLLTDYYATTKKMVVLH
ncbi:MAG: T9SS type A sorting domain-containing protein [Bacteroidota bacterium]